MEDGKMLKEGSLVIKSGLRKKDCYCVLNGTGKDNPAHLACYDNKEAYQKDKNKASKKCHYLENIKGIDKIIKSSKNEYHLDISTKKEKFLLMAESPDDIEDWYKYINAIHKGQEDLLAPADGSFRTNILYDSSEDTATFEVTVRQTELSMNHFLKNRYKLHITAGGISLEDPETYKIVFHFPYEFIRKFGKKRDVFAISAGRRCDSGEGELEFELDEPERITQAIDIKTGKKVEARKVNSEIRSSKKDSDDSDSQVAKRTSEPVLESEKSKSLPKDARNSTTDKGVSHDYGLNISKAMIDKDKDLKKTLEKQTSNESHSTHQKGEKSEKERKVFGIFGKKSKKGSKSEKTKDKTNQNDSPEPELLIYDEAEPQKAKVLVSPQATEPLYDDAVTKSNTSSKNQLFYDSSEVPVGSMYAEAGNRSEAWKQFAESGDYHEEYYDKVRDAASENDKNKKFQIEKDYEDDDETYDKLTLNSHARNQREYHSAEIPGHIYGITGSKAVEEVEDDYTFAEADQYEDYNGPAVPPKAFEPEDDTYDDTALCEYDDAASTKAIPRSQVRLDAYEEVDIDSSSKM